MIRLISMFKYFPTHIHILNSFFKLQLRPHFTFRLYVAETLLWEEAHCLHFWNHAACELAGSWVFWGSDTGLTWEGALISPFRGKKQRDAPAGDPLGTCPHTRPFQGLCPGCPGPHLGVGRPGYTVGREAGREEASPAPATVRGNEERQLQSAPGAGPGTGLQLERRQRTFQALQPRCPGSFFFF